MFGTEPTVTRQCEPLTIRPSCSSTSTPSPTRRTAGRPRLPDDVHPAAGEDVLDQQRGVGVLARHDAVAAGDQRDLAAQREVGAGELRPGHAGADHDEVLGQLRQVVDLLPVEDSLAVRLRRRAAPEATLRSRSARRRR